jgi:hypothetical protein
MDEMWCFQQTIEPEELNKHNHYLQTQQNKIKIIEHKTW